LFQDFLFSNIFFSFFNYSFIHMCIHYLGHFSPVSLPHCFWFWSLTRYGKFLLKASWLSLRRSPSLTLGSTAWSRASHLRHG
jgi:hypothetical protein